MNLHEECLLKYLLNPKDLLNSTELLRYNNLLIKEGNFSIINSQAIKYSATIV